MGGTTQPASGGPQAPLPGARSALVLLLLINLFNYIDRQVLAAVEPNIRAEFFPVEDDLTKFWMGLLQFAFMVTYMLASPVFGVLAERYRRWSLVAIGVAVWTLASGGSGLATAFVLLLLTRCLVGVGEGAYGPVAPAVISDLYPVRTRGKVLAWFYAAIPVGSALGYTLGGQIAGTSLGWRWAFYVVVPPGVLLAILCLLMPEPRRGQADAAPLPPDSLPAGQPTSPAAEPPRLRWAGYRVLLQTRSYVLCTLGMTAMSFALGGMAYWMSAYLKYKNVEPLWGKIEPVTAFGAISALAGLVATLAGGIAGDALKPRFGGSYFLVSGIAMLVAFPFILLFLHTPFPAAWIVLSVVVFCLFFNTGPTNTILANVTHPSIRAAAFGLNILIIHLFGDASSPFILGLIIGKEERFRLGFIVVSVLVLVGGLLWLWGMRDLQRDTDLAPHRIAG